MQTKSNTVEEILYENEHYVVGIAEGHIMVNDNILDWHYQVINKKTGIVELKHTSLPFCLNVAERSSVELEQENHLWVRKATREEGHPFFSDEEEEDESSQVVLQFHFKPESKKN